MPIWKSHSVRKEPTPEEVIAGASISALELVRMIHRINPTYRGLSTGKTEGLYFLKSRLQSLLIKRFPDSITIDLPSSTTDVVSIRLRHFPENACHARIDSLDRDIQPTVRRLLNEAQSAERAQRARRNPSPPPPVTSESDREPEIDTDRLSVSQLLELGRKAVDSFDFEQAERCFTSAYETSGRSIDATRALIEFYVEQFGCYEKAIDLAAKTGPSSMRDPRIARLATLAAARSGRFNIVIESLSSPAARSAEACLAAFRHLRDLGDIDHALNFFNMFLLCADVREFDSSAVRAEVDEMLTRRTESIENDLRSEWISNRFDTAEVIAKQLLILNPQHALAKTVIDTIENIRRKLRFNRLTELARDAKRESNPDSVVQCLQEAMEYGSLNTEYREWLRDARQELERRAETKEAGVIDALLNDGNTRDALRAFARLKPDFRNRILPRFEDTRFKWLDSAAGNAPIRDIDVLIDAVETLKNAIAALERKDDPTGVSNLLNPLLGTLNRVSDYRTAEEEARNRVQASLKSRALKCLRELEQSIREGDFAVADAKRHSIDAESLDPGDRASMNRLVMELDRRLDIQSRIAQFEKFKLRGNLFDAVEIAETLRTDATIADTDRWVREIESLHRRIDEEWRVVVFEGDPPEYCSRILNHLTHPYLYSTCLTQDGRRIIIVDDLDELILIRTFRIDLCRFEYTIVICPPRPPFQCNCIAHGPELYISSTNAYCFVFSLESFHVTKYFDAENITSKEPGFEDSILIPRRNLLWLVEKNIRKSAKIHIINPANRRIVRSLSLGLQPEVIFAANRILIFDDTMNEGIRLYEEDGRQIVRLQLEKDIICNTVSVHPDDKHLILVTGLSDMIDWTDDPHPDYSGGELRIEIRSGAVIEHEPIVLQGSNSIDQHTILTSRSKNLIFILYGKSASEDSKQFVVDAFQPSIEGLKCIYSIGVPRSSFLLTNIDSNHVVLVSCQADKLFAVTLDDIPPILQPETVIHECKINYPESLEKLDRCVTKTPLIKESVRSKGSRRSGDDPLPETDDPDALLDYVEVVRKERLHEQAKRIEDHVLRIHQNHPRCRAILAQKSLRMGKFNETIDLLQNLPGSTSSALGAHIQHLLGIAHFGKGNLKEAIACWREGEALQHPECGFEELIEYARFCSLPAAERARDPDRKELAAFFDVVSCVRDHLKRGEIHVAAEYLAERLDNGFSFTQLLALATEIFVRFPVDFRSHQSMMRVILQEILRREIAKKYFISHLSIFPPDIGNRSHDDLRSIANKRD